MIKRILFFIMILCTSFVFSQQQILLSYQQNFLRASLSAKQGILQDAATDYRSGEFIGALYEFALKYALNYSEYLRDDTDMISLTAAAARGVGISGSRESAGILWDVFLAYRDPYSRVEVLGALLRLGKDEKIIYNLNEFIVSQHDLYRSGVMVDLTTLSACISTLSSFKDPSSFYALFPGLTAGYPQYIRSEIQRAIESLDGNYQQSLINAIQKNSPAEKLAAFRLGTESEKLKYPSQGDLAEVALQAALNYTPRNNESVSEINLLRFDAIRIITSQKWTRANSLVIKHFYKVQEDYQNGAASKERYMEAITCLGVMGNSESAQLLAIQLGYYNSRAERSAGYDSDILLCLINAIGETGDKSARDNLLYVSYLNYPEPVQTAAKDALARLRW